MSAVQSSYATGAGERGAGVPTPAVTGPVPSDPPGSPGRNYTFLATDADIAGRGYVEEEFFYSGTANWYDAPNPAPNNMPPAPVAGIVSPGHPYKTRLLVYRPASPERFSGMVFVEWTNASGGFDNPIWWQRNHDYIMREGHAYVGVAAQHYGVNREPHGLKHWSPGRYGTLDIPHVGEYDDKKLHDDRLTYDVFAQGMKAVRAVPEVMGGLKVQHLIAGGLSRSAIHLTVYLNAIHPRAPIADGVMLMVLGGQLRDDADIPVMKVYSESEWEMWPEQITGRQPDTDLLRTWWVTGASHSDHQGAMIAAAIRRRDLPDIPVWDEERDPPSHSRIENHYATEAAMDAMVTWVRDGVPPAHSPLPEWTPTDPPVTARDKHGNGLGGIRLATLAVPVAKDQGKNPDADDAHVAIAGVHVPFDTETLQGLYPSREEYVRKVTEAAEGNVRDGFLLERDAADLIAKAQNSIVGTGLVSGPLCANVSNFLNHPSTSNLRDHTLVCHFRGGERLLAILDEANRLVAEGYTAARQSDHVTRKQKFDEAIRSLRRYVDEVAKMPADGRAAQATADLLVDFATTLIEKITAEAGRTA